MIRSGDRCAAPGGLALRAVLFGLASVVCLAAAACSASTDGLEDLEPTVTPVPAATATAAPTPAPTATSTPVPVGADVVSDTTYGAARVAIVAGSSPDSVEVRALTTGSSTIEVEFSLDAFVALASFADPRLGSDPLVTQAAETLSSPWSVRLVGGQVYVQQAELAVAAGGTAEQWVVVDDPATLDLLSAGGLLGGGLDHAVMVDVVRSAAGALAEAPVEGLLDVEGPQPDGVVAYDTVIDGAQLSALGRSPSDTAALIGLAGLETASTPVRIWVDAAGVLVQVQLEVTATAVAAGSDPASFVVGYRDAAGDTVEAPEDLVASAG